MSGHGQQFEHEELLSALAQDYGAYGASNPDQFAGLICIASVVFLWVGSSELIREFAQRQRVLCPHLLPPCICKPGRFHGKFG